MHDPSRWRNDTEVGKGLLPPAQEGVALAIAFVLDRNVLLQRVSAAKDVHLHRVIDDEIHRDQRIDLGWIPAQARHSGAHRSQIDDRWHTREILQNHARWHERQLDRGRLGRLPSCQAAHVVLADAFAVGMPQERLEQDSNRVRQSLQIGCHARLLQGVETPDCDRALGGGQLPPGSKGIVCGHRFLLPSSRSADSKGVEFSPDHS